MATLELDDVRKSYGRIDVLHGISCNIGDGEMVVLVGPSGCGKSTLLRTIAGLEGLTGGDIRIAGRSVTHVPPKDRDIAMVFQNYALYPHMSVYQNMEYGLKIRGLPAAEIKTRVGEAAAILGLDGLLDRKPGQLSGGQRQRVAMGRAIVRKPALFLFDEPLSNLDAKLRGQMRVELRRLQRDLATTAVYVTHDQVEAMTLADRLIVMNGGRAEQIGRPLEIYARPASLFVAEFIGAPPMNILPAVIGPDGGHVRVADGGLLALPRPMAPGRAIRLGIRPEHLAPAPAATLPSFGLTGRVELVEALGADTLVHFRLGRADTLIARFPGDALPPLDTRLTLTADPASLHLFDSADGRRL